MAKIMFRRPRALTYAGIILDPHIKTAFISFRLLAQKLIVSARVLSSNFEQQLIVSLGVIG